MAWYALYTRPRHEKSVHSALLEKGIDAFLPMTTEMRQWKDRKKQVEIPLFSGYVLVNIELKNRIYALETDGVVRLIGFGGKPAEIPHWQIEQLRRLVENKTELTPEDWLRQGDSVIITSGPLEGIRGYLQERRSGNIVVVLLEGIRQAASFVVNSDQLEKLEDEDVATRA
ncbi:MAG: UpxY family transcription antiterminator [Calditrichia bacterium]